MVSLKAVISSVSVLVAMSTHAVLADNPINPSFPYGSTKVRGVNLGVWLVLEVSLMRHSFFPAAPHGVG